MQRRLKPAGFQLTRKGLTNMSDRTAVKEKMTLLFIDLTRELTVLVIVAVFVLNVSSYWSQGINRSDVYDLKQGVYGEDFNRDQKGRYRAILCLMTG